MLTKNEETNTAPSLKITKLGIVFRDYRHKFENGFRDFSYALPRILKLLDDAGCDAVLFSLFSIVHREDYNPSAAFKELVNVKAVFLEKYQEGKESDPKLFVVYHRTSETSESWSEYTFEQKFGTITHMPKKDIEDFVENEMPKRILGNCCVLLCGETNGVKYSPKDKEVHDTFGLREQIHKQTETAIILNPIHDRMTRFEMKLKRKFLSENNRFVVSVWNKGKKNKNGKVLKEKTPAWTVYLNGQKEIIIPAIEHDIQEIEIGILGSVDVLPSVKFAALSDFKCCDRTRRTRRG
jgi:hypothetical protein